MINAISIALSGLNAAAKRLGASASNIANLQTVGSVGPGDKPPYTPLDVSQTVLAGQNGQGQGVKAGFIPRDPAFVPAFDPDSPFADENGVIGVPNVDLAGEAVNQILAKTAYKANVQVIRVAEDMSDELLKALDRGAG